MKRFIYLYLIAAVVFSPAIGAQVYSWQDSEGRTHYSDKPLDANAREQSLDIGDMPAMRVLEPVAPLVFDDSYVPPLVSDPRYRLEQNNKIAYFYFGGDCVSPTRLDYQELKQRYRHALPPADDLRRDLAAVLQRSFARGVKTVGNQNAALMPNKAAPYLQANITDMRINACSPAVPRQVPADALSVFSLGMFKRSNVWLQVTWSLVSRETGATLATVVTEGASENPAGERKGIPQVIDQAFRDAATRLLHESSVIDKLQRQHRQQPLPAQMPEDRNGPSVPEGYKGLLVNANLAKVLSSLAQVRFRLTDYFVRNNEWPVSLDEIEHHGQSLAATGLVDSLELRYAGILHVNLKEAEFPGDQVLQMVPTWDSDSGQLFWDCRTTVNTSLSACEEF